MDSMRKHLLKWSSKIYVLGVIASLGLTYWSYHSFKGNFEKFDSIFSTERTLFLHQRAIAELNLQMTLLTSAVALEDEKNAFTILEGIRKTLSLLSTTQTPSGTPSAQKAKNLSAQLGQIPEITEKIHAKLSTKNHPYQEVAELVVELQKIYKENSDAEENVVNSSMQEKKDWIAEQERIQGILRWSFILISVLLISVSLLKAALSSLEKERIETSKLNSILIDSLNDAVMLILKSGSIATANAAAGRLFHRSPSELIGMDVSQVFKNVTKRDGQLFKTQLHPLLSLAHADRPFQNVIMGIPLDSESLWLDVSSQPLTTDLTKSESCLFTLRDVTEVVNQQKVIESQQAQIIQSSKLSALGEMAAGIAHEINNPLHIIHMEADTILEASEETDDTADDIKKSSTIILDTVNRASKIIKGLLSFSREGTQDPLKPESLNQIINDTLVFCEKKFSTKKVPLKIEVEDDLKIECRSTQVSQVVLNLLNNALDAISQHPDPWVRLRAFRADRGLIRVEISDAGNGMPAEVRDKIFQPFFTTKPVGQGTGLGLSICKGIIEAHKGKLWVDADQPNTTFVIELPMARAAA